MRPLAKAVTRSLDTVRRLIREQCLSPLPEYTEKLREHLKIFDRVKHSFFLCYFEESCVLSIYLLSKMVENGLI